MKTLILCVDRDDDIGQKADVETPIVGRRRLVDAATALGCADPEDSDTNSLFAAVHLFDKELADIGASDRQLEVAAVAGHPRMGLRADRRLAQELDEVLELTHADEVILVSDGAEDEQIMPILTSRVRVAHVHRTIVRQAPRLEGFYYTITRLFEDKKLGKRLVLPLGIATLVWAAAFATDQTRYAGAITLGIVGAWLIVHAMNWEDRMSRFFTDLSEGMRSGKVALLANIVAVVLIVYGLLDAYNRIRIQRVPGVPLDPAAEALAEDQILRSLVFLDTAILFIVVGLLVRTAGILFDQWVREGKASLRHWTAAFTLVAFGFIGSAILKIGIALREGTPVPEILDFELVMRLFTGILIAMSGVVVSRYVKTFFDDDATVRP